MKYIVLIGKPSSGKTTISQRLIDIKQAKGAISIESFREVIERFMPKELDSMIKEDLAWTLFGSGIKYKEDKDDACVVNLCGINKREMGVIDALMGEDVTYIKLVCDTKVLLNRVKKRKDRSELFPYQLLRKDLVKLKFASHIKSISFDLVLDTGKLIVDQCIEKIIKVLEE